MDKICVLGSITIDNTVYTDNLPIGGMTVFGTSTISNLGGKGANQAAAIHKLGGNVLFFGSIGKDKNGEFIKEELDKVGMKYELKESDRNSTVAFIIIDNKTAENRIIMVPGANLDLSDKDIDLWWNLIKDSKYLVTQLETNIDTTMHLIKRAKEAGITVILNPAPYSPFDLKYLQFVDFLVPNEHELEQITNEGNTFEEKAKSLLKYGVKNVIVTLGEKGSLLVNNQEVYEQTAIKVDAVDTTGAGDSYIGAFTYALSNKMGVKEAMAFATKASSITVQRKGAIISLPSIEEMKR